MGKIRTASSKTFDTSDTDSSISYEITEDETSVSTPTCSPSFMDPIEAVTKKPDNVLEKFVEIGGRRYFNDDSVKCFLPVDQEEIKRAHEQTCIDNTIWNGSYSAPISENLSLGASVLDVGCGAGSWMINTALDYPKSVFVGVDIIPIFSEDRPPNTVFLKCNVLDGLPFPDNTFDFVRQTYLIISMDWQSWKEKVVKELIRVTKPGGYIEIMDVDGESTNPGIMCRKIEYYLYEHMRKAGINPRSGQDVIKVFNEFDDKVIVAPIEERTYHLGKKAGEIGKATLKCIADAYRTMKIIFTHIMEITEEEFEQLLIDFEKECNEVTLCKTRYRAIIKKR
ncbi:11377_t:CDS:2 [Paraglomus occultum]|uniref:11377_t:CDS:1 n=1 Tax=Paraglomus occultum TaxID=144539 RepID=A0A9N8W0I4_9GLOM|nr:11377_t:CDS:2 [Paraglomus occultum]